MDGILGKNSGRVESQEREPRMIRDTLNVDDITTKVPWPSSNIREASGRFLLPPEIKVYKNRVQQPFNNLYRRLDARDKATRNKGAQL